MRKTKQSAVSVESRRNFLKTVVAAGGGAAVIAAGNASASSEMPAVEQPNEKLGYQETEHIRNYYSRADF